MAWVRGDDGAKDNRRVLRAGVGGFLKKKTFKSPQMERATVFGFVALCVAWSAGKYTDLFIPDYLAYDVGGPDTDWLVRASIKAGFFGPQSVDEHGDSGWQVIDNGDNLFHVRTREEVELARNRDYNSRLSVDSLQVQARDGDQCRYCLHPVTPLVKKGGDNQSPRSRTLDHVDPNDPDTDRVVACRECNTRKQRRTPQDAGMPLYPPPAERGADIYYHPRTVKTFAELGYDYLLSGAKQEQKLSNEQSKDQATSKASGDQEQTKPGVKSEASPGRDGRSGLVGAPAGTGQVGSGPDPVVPLRAVRDETPGGVA